MFNENDRFLIRKDVHHSLAEPFLIAVPCTPFVQETHLRWLAAVSISDIDKASSLAGRASYKEARIEMNVRICSTPERYRDTLIHEWAHLLSHRVFGKTGEGHGQLWKQTMFKLGAEPSRCHNYDVAAALPEKYSKVVCLCGHEFAFSNRKMNNVRKGVLYRCSRCKRSLAVSASK